MNEIQIEERPDCPACAEAKENPLTGILQMGCYGCLVRQISNAPAAKRNELYAWLPAGAAQNKIRAEALAEHTRRKAFIERSHHGFMVQGEMGDSL